MRKKEYIQRAKNAILNRIRFHAPVLYDDNIDRRVLFENGVKADLPVFKFDKVLNKRLIKSFELAQKEENFNLLLSFSCIENVKQKHLKPLQNLVVYSQFSPLSFVEMINKLNINYPSSSNYNVVYKDKFFKVNDEVLNPKYDNFALKSKTKIDGVEINYSEFVLNGNNYFAEFENKTDENKKLEIELNLPLKKGYYYFKKNNKFILIENLLTKEKFYFNFICKNAKFSFSNVNGLENSVFCCVNVKVSLSLSKDEEKFVFFNFGSSKFLFKDWEHLKLYQELSTIKCQEIFNLQVLTKNPKFDQYFNFKLPQKIWINWLNGQPEGCLEEKYVALKRLFIRGKDKISFVNFKEIGVRELGIFNGRYYKKIVIVQSDNKFLRVGETAFYNINGVTEHSLKSREPICLSFGL